MFYVDAFAVNHFFTPGNTRQVGSVWMAAWYDRVELPCCGYVMNTDGTIFAIHPTQYEYHSSWCTHRQLWPSSSLRSIDPARDDEQTIGTTTFRLGHHSKGQKDGLGWYQGRFRGLTPGSASPFPRGGLCLSLTALDCELLICKLPA